MAIRVTLSANAGVSVELGGVRIWIDALHDTRVPGFSTLDSHLLQRLWSEAAFQSPDAIVYTHCHPDHYAAHLTAEACRRWPKARLFLPQKDFPEQELLSGREAAASIEGVALHFYRLTHDGMAFAGVPHYGLTITCGRDSILLPGDCAVASPELLPVVNGRHLRLALLNFPWATLQRGRDFLREQLHADRSRCITSPLRRMIPRAFARRQIVPHKAYPASEPSMCSIIVFRPCLSRMKRSPPRIADKSKPPAKPEV